MFRGVTAVTIAEERKAHPCGERAYRERNPRQNFRPAESAMKCGARENSQGHYASEEDGALQSPTNSRGQRHEQIQKPKSDGGMGKQNENCERCQIETQW